ncbi:uncharacterized protein LOC126868685 [Bombus huntii]|uniref:uncharacterized protein LOC126868685 n=1 Tax=Bombus huntii TaxID=85661 RepID=UPI0021AA63AA|nr:uncharacterized protein LOC126868685 [Bombus huntii]
MLTNRFGSSFHKAPSTHDSQPLVVRVCANRAEGTGRGGECDRIGEGKSAGGGNGGGDEAGGGSSGGGDGGGNGGGDGSGGNDEGGGSGGGGAAGEGENGEMEESKVELCNHRKSGASGGGGGGDAMVGGGSNSNNDDNGRKNNGSGQDNEQWLRDTSGVTDIMVAVVPAGRTITTEVEKSL